MKLCSDTITNLKRGLVEMKAFQNKMFDNGDCRNYTKELLELSWLMGTIEAIIEMNEI